MAGRRRHRRYEVKNGTGTLRILRDVTVKDVSGNELIVTSCEPARVGERLTIERVRNGITVRTPVRVIEARLAMRDGGVRHLLRLKPVASAAR